MKVHSMQASAKHAGAKHAGAKHAGSCKECRQLQSMLGKYKAHRCKAIRCYTQNGKHAGGEHAAA